MKGNGSPIVEPMSNIMRQDYSGVNPDEVIVEVDTY
jgi:hypothetical protein